METRLDGEPMVQLRVGYWCCLLCLRQFKSEAHIRKHLSRSAMHAENLAAAAAAGRIVDNAGKSERTGEPAKRSLAAASADAEPPSKRLAAVDSCLPHVTHHCLQ